MGKAASLWYLARVVLKPILFLAAVLLGLSYVAMPWAVPIPGRSTLTGNWVGEVHTSHGPDAWLFLSLQPGHSLAPLWTYVFGSSQFGSPPGARLEGRAVLCSGPRGRIALNLRGYTRSRRGDILKLLLDPVRHSRPELRLVLDGQWDGSALELVQRGFSLAGVLGLPEEGVTAGGDIPDRWIEATLTKGGEHELDDRCSKSP
jgi:hypothetical protein